MKVVILAGGRGTRISEESDYMPKPMIEIDDKPIIWHIMKEYSHYGFNEFVICCGYKQYMIKEWFNDYFLHNCDVTFEFKGGKRKVIVNEANIEPWSVTVVDTGYDTMTGGRIKRIQEYVGNEPFFMTYGDGVCDVDINKLLEFHKSHGKKATITAVTQKQDKGVLDINYLGAVRSFREKQSNAEVSINAGYMVLEPAIFDYLKDDTTILEREPLETLAKEGELMSYRHKGFWQCMDSLHEKRILEELIAQNAAPWKVW